MFQSQSSIIKLPIHPGLYTRTHTQPASQLALEQVPNHLLARNVRRLPERRKIKRAGQAVGEAKEEHGRDPAAGVLEREAALGHLVLLGVAAAQVVHAAGGIHLGFVRAGHVGDLRAGQDVEVVVGCVAAGVALCANGRALGISISCLVLLLLDIFAVFLLTKDDEILSHAGMQDIHGSHGPAGIVKHPVLLQVDISRHLLVELVHNVLDDAPRVVAMLGDAPLRKVVQVVRIEDVEPLQVLVEHVHHRRQQRCQ